MEWLPAPMGEHQRTGSPRQCLRPPSRISRARSHRGTRCRRLVFARLAGTVHTPLCRSISAHSAHRTSPHLAAVSTRNSNASRAAGTAADARTFRITAAASRWGTACMCSVTSRLGAKHRADPVAGVVQAVLHGHGPFQDRTQALAHTLGRGYLPVPEGREDLQHVGAGDL